MNLRKYLSCQFLISVFCLVSNFSLAQEWNLIPYGNLEVSELECESRQEYQAWSMVDEIPGGHWVSWHQYTVDWFNKCSPIESHRPPLTVVGYQPAQYGTNYGGLIFLRELIWQQKSGLKAEYTLETAGVRLKEELIQDSIYFFQGYFSLSSDGRIPVYNCGRLDFLFHDDSLKTHNIPPQSPINNWLYPDADVVRVSANHLNDVDWIKLSFFYTAKGGEKFLSFGQIWNDSSDVPVCHPAPLVLEDTILGTASYLLFDNLSLTKGVPNLELDLPNVFSPNGDGIYDTYAFLLEGVYDEINYQIFNRWGAQVYEGDAFSKPWDGTHLNGKPCEEGVYFVKVKAKERYGIWKETSGFVHLVR